MRSAAGLLGIIGGLIGMLVGFFGYGWVEATTRAPELAQTFGAFDNPGFIQFASFVGPLLAIAGGAMARTRRCGAVF